MDAHYSYSIKDYLFDIAKIIEGATNTDYAKVAAYSKQLSQKLEAQGEHEAAKRIRQILDGSKVQKLGFARAGHRNHNGTSIPHLPVDSESRLTLADEEHPKQGTVEIFLPVEVLETVNQFLSFFRAADRLIANGVGISASMVIHGPPGCGKTQLAKFIAAELNLPLLIARTDGLISSYLGSTAKNLRMLFEHAASRPCVLFLDEFDALAKMRDDPKEVGELKRVVISLLQNIDALGKDHVLLAATNHEHLLDPAIWRRFSYNVKLIEPDLETRRKMVKKYFGVFANDDLVEVTSIVTEGFTGAQLREVIETRIRQAILDDKAELTVAEALASFLSANPKMHQQPLKSVAEQIRFIRTLNKKLFTQVRLAQIFKLSQSQISKILNGEAYAE